MFHRQKSDQDAENAKNDTANAQDHSENYSDKNANQSQQGQGGDAPDVSIPPATGVSGQRRIGVRIAQGSDQGESEKADEATSETSQSTSRPFTGFNRLQPQVNRHQQQAQSDNADQREQTDNTPTDQQEDSAVNIQPPSSQNQSSEDQSQGQQDAAFGETQSQPSQAPGTSVSDGRQLIVGKGISLTGEIQECNHLVVEGRVEAALKGSKVLEIKEEGTFIGGVEIEQATIAGVFEGEITVNGRLTITENGKITGTIAYKELEIQAGAKIDGKISPIGSAGSKTESKADEKSSKEDSADDKSKQAKAAAKSDSNASKKKDAELPLSENA